MFRKKKHTLSARTPHPNAAVELKLQHIMSLNQLRAGCMTQITAYQDEITRAHKALDDAVYEYRLNNIMTHVLEHTQRVTTDRVRAAEEGIREQRAVVTSLQQQITAAVDDASLTPFDLAYLSLSALAQ